MWRSKIAVGKARTRALLISGLTLGADQLTKRLIAMSFMPGQSLPLIPSLLSLTYVQNTGAAFGLLKGRQWLFIALSVMIVGWMGWELLTKRPLAAVVVWGSSLIIGGALGNLIDRLRVGHVIDFIDLHVWPVFNVGDSAITIGVGLLILHSLWLNRGRGAGGERREERVG